MNEPTLKKVIAGVILSLFVFWLVAMATSCSSRHLTKSVESKKMDSTIVHDSSASSVKKSDSTIANTNLSSSHHGLTVLFDNYGECEPSGNATNDYEGGNDSTAKVKAKPAQTYSYKFNGKEIISPKPIDRIFLDDDSSNALTNFVNVKKSDSTQFGKHDSTKVVEQVKTKNKEVIKKGGIPFWFWLLLLLIIAAIIYWKRDWIVDKFVKYIE